MNQPRSRPALHRAVWLAPCLWMLVLLAGCAMGEGVTIPGLTQQGTPTANPTLLAIETMLTGTASVPTATQTQQPTITPQPSPTGTVTPEPPAAGQIGQAIAAKNVSLAVLSSAFAGELGEHPAAEGRTFLDLEVSIENLAPPESSSLTYTSVYFTLTGDDGTVYSAFAFPQEALSAGMPPRLLGGDLLPGETVHGHVAFEVPVEPGMLTLNFAPPATASGDLPPQFVVTLTQADGSIPTGGPDSIPATGAADTGAWLSESLPGQDQFAQNNGVSLKIEMVRAEGSFEGRRAPTGNRFVILDAVIRNDSRPQVPYNPQYFKLKDEHGYEYPPVILPGDGLLQAGSLVEGEMVKGMVVFQIPLETQRVGVLYKPQVLAEEWNAFRIVINIPGS